MHTLASPGWALVHKTTYDLYGPVRNAFDAGSSISWASGRGLGPWNLEIFGPQMALAYRLDAISQEPKKPLPGHDYPDPANPERYQFQAHCIFYFFQTNSICCKKILEIMTSLPFMSKEKLAWL
jgi:hypothetical protein